MSETYGAKVRWQRRELRMSGRDLCRQAGITPSYLSDIETGRRLPAPTVSDRIADCLGVDCDGLWRLALLERLSERDLRALGKGEPHTIEAHAACDPITCEVHGLGDWALDKSRPARIGFRDFGGVTSVNLPNLEVVIPLAEP